MANRTVTVKSSGGDYTTLNAALAGEFATYPDLVANQMILTIECYSSSGTDGVDITAASTGTGWTTSASYYINIVVPAANRHAGKYGTSCYRMSQAAITLGEDYTRCTGILQVYASSSTNTACTLSGQYTLADKCLMIGAANPRIGFSLSGANAKTTNCIARGMVRQGFLVAANNAEVVNCSVLRKQGTTSYIGFTYSSGTGVKFINCLSYNPSQIGFSINNANVTAYNNASDDATADDKDSGTNTCRASQTFTFVNDANAYDTEDMHLASNDAGARTYGTSTGAPTDDVDGETRSGSWDIGADQYVSASSGPANMKTALGLAKASVKTMNGLALASVKTANGLA